MNRINILGGLVLAGSLGLGGCFVEAHPVAEPVAVVEVDSEPPPPQYEEVVVRPGYIWIQGRWNWAGGRWVWMGGRYEPERVGYEWAPGRWEARGGRHVWVEGNWHARAAAAPAGGVEVRDHRRPEERREGPVVRDHRHD
jgi:hypothetical protein